ncbi:CRISPR-associated endonuclease Cas2 [Candidatus Berkelbacteria bacterium RBG_13_40_8]|uniref:CRISPR-associated endonuclease Cas2 n=1 Tax=Candidatus Berkelbacteria bacterium RBG_13_40_8 TaxID=1797467 RepID=A0A1F5DML2_9BACT|nr:MAG: CRISPR-associated endonuclease Cas2 [Candidatus Berkelbacteria bacterium RBG_13_40_8]
MKKSNKKLTLVKNILLDIVDTAKDINQIMTRPSLWGKDYPKRNKQTFFNTVDRLEKEGFLKKIESMGRKRYIATLKGKAKVLAYLKKDKKWDGKWRIVVFDIPETKKKIRDFFREKLFDLGFRKLQESVWICPYNIADTVEDLILLCNAKPYIHYLLVEELDDHDTLIKLFKLKK